MSFKLVEPSCFFLKGQMQEPIFPPVLSWFKNQKKKKTKKKGNTHSLRCKEDLKEEGFVARNPWQEKRKLQKQKGRERKACSSSYPWTWTMKWMTSGSDNSGIRLRLCVLLRFIGIRWHSRDVKKRNFQIQAMLSFFSPFLGCECEFYTIYGLAHSMITHLWFCKAHQILIYCLKKKHKFSCNKSYFHFFLLQSYFRFLKTLH